MLNRDEARTIPLDQLSGLSRDDKLLAWQEASAQLAPLVLREKQLRMMAVAATFPEAIEGTNSLPLGNGYIVKCEMKMNYSVVDTPEMRNEFIETLGTERAAQVVKFKPDLSVTGWKKTMTQEERDKLAHHVTIKPGLPSLSIIAPGEAGNKQP